MLTAILPIRTEQNSFWSSSKGFEHINIFLDTFTSIGDIDRLIVITQDDRVSRLAEQKGMEISSIDIPGSVERPYTFEQTRCLARNFSNFCTNETDALIVADHRNLFLTAGDLSRALAVHRQNPDNGVISLAFCRDYPCQFKAFYTFMGCLVIPFDRLSKKNKISTRIQSESPAEMPTPAERCIAEIMVSVSVKGPGYGISFYSQNIPVQNFIAQILPFDPDGPRYAESQEIFVKTGKQETRLTIDTGKVAGIIFLFTIPVESGEYDTIELFTPENASWEIGEFGSIVYNKMNHEPLHGRQQFPPAYTYDGSLCILGTKNLTDDTASNIFPVIIRSVCIVTDWVDYWYWYSVANHQNTDELES